MPVWAQWLGFWITFIGGIISAFVLYQAFQLKNIFLLKAKLPKLHENLSSYRERFNILLVNEPNNFQEMSVIQAEVISVLDQAKPYLSSPDANKIDKVHNQLSTKIVTTKSSWDFYQSLASLETHVASSSEDLKWNS